MGTAKAALLVDGVPMGQRAADALRAVAAPVFEIGPGFTDLPAVADAGIGPLGALAAGWAAIIASSVETAGGSGILVLACDLPLVGAPMLRLLAEHPGEGTVVPVADGRPQTLCARWSAAAMARTGELVARGDRRMSTLLSSEPNARLLEAEIWATAVHPNALDDADTPDQFAALTRLLRRDPLVPGTAVDRSGGRPGFAEAQPGPVTPAGAAEPASHEDHHAG